MKRFNLSEWALAHRSVVVYLMLVIVIAGVGSYVRLGRSEDPDFTVKTMVVQAGWPGAAVASTSTTKPAPSTWRASSGTVPMMRMRPP